MNKDNIKTEIIVKEQRINVLRIDNKEFISLTDLARYANSDEPKIPIYAWMRNKDVLAYLGLWEQLNNENFKGHEFETFENEAGKNSFYMSPQKWIKETNAVGIISKSGNNGGTYARSDIALEFASWLSPEFKLYVIQEFERLKKNEAYQNKIDWHANRVLARVSYVVHTNAIKSIIVPTLTEKQKKFVYAEEADVLNVALFGMTAKEWRESNPEIADKGNIRDYTDLLHLVILNNLENNNTFVNYVYHILVSGTDTQRYYDDLLLHETLHFCGSGGSFAISEGINELLTRQIAHEFGYHTNGCAYPNEVKVALRLSKVFGSDVITRLAFIRNFKQSLDYLDMTLGSAASSLYNDVMIAMEDEFQEKYYKNMDSYNGLVGIARKTIDYRKINYKKANELIDEYEKKLLNPEQQHSK